MLPFTSEELEERVKSGHVRKQTHPEFPLTIYNYTPRAVYDRVWDEVTMTCRGLILDNNFNVQARPFRKFKNYGEILLKEIPQRPPLVYSKCDGSLGIIHRFGGRYQVATRGSFTSEQALWATGFLNIKYPDLKVPAGITPLVEIIYPDNRIVVNYQGLEDLVLLGAIDNETGADIPLWEIDWWPGSIVESHHGLDSAESAYTYGMSEKFEREEGVVLVWLNPGKPSIRIKCKHTRYVELHRVLTGISVKRIWEALQTGDNFDDLLEIAPDEWLEWVRKVSADLRAEFGLIESACKEDFAKTPEGSRREIAEFYKTCKYPGLLFAMLDNKDYSKQIWQLVKPSESQTFRQDIDES